MLDGTTFGYVFVSSPILVETLFSHGCIEYIFGVANADGTTFLIMDTSFLHFSLPHRSFASCPTISIHSQV